VSQRSVPFRARVSKSQWFVMWLRCRTTDAVLLSQEEY